MGVRMRCERYGAEMPVSTCLALRKRAMIALNKWRHSGAAYDPGCARCEQGTAEEAEAGDTGASPN
jgi:hypothetical protein